MTFRLTDKLSKKIKAVRNEAVPTGTDPLLDWAADLFIFDRFQYILITHRPTILSCFLYGKAITDSTSFIRAAGRIIGECLEDYGCGSIFENIIGPGLYSVQFTKVRDRKLNGIMTDLVRCAKAHLSVEDTSPIMLTNVINKMPQLSMPGAYPVEAFRNLLEDFQRNSKKS